MERRLTKNEKRRLKKKERPNEPTVIIHTGLTSNEVEVQYVAPEFSNELHLEDNLFNHFKHVFEKFHTPEELLSNSPRFQESRSELITPISEPSSSAERIDSGPAPLSKKKKKLLTRLSVSELKQLVSRSDVVEAHDITSSDPRLLIHLKAYRNTVPVPRHWCHVRKYLQGKRGIEKVPYQLPEFIAETGIAKIRETILEQEALKKGKQKARERIRPKMGRIDIDYQVLHDAFFKFQSKPKMNGHGDLYYESKEFEVQAKEKKPGSLSNELIQALGMSEGSPPPWLINMQRYGPPPSYPNLKIPGLNAPLPLGAAYGYQPGGWGKPPVDDFGRPLYGDVFGVSTKAEVGLHDQIDKSFRWGIYEDDISQIEEDDDEVSDDESVGGKPVSLSDVTLSGIETPRLTEGTHTIVSGLETPATIDLRKRKGVETPDTVVSVQALYQVVQERKSLNDGQMFASEKEYVFENSNLSEKPLQGVETDNHVSEKNKKRKAEETLISRKIKEFKF